MKNGRYDLVDEKKVISLLFSGQVSSMEEKRLEEKEVSFGHAN
jgi:hypothetical protein